MGVMDTLLSGSAPGFKFDKIGDEVTGVVVELDERQDNVYNSANPAMELLWWNRPPGPARNDPADRPKMVPVFTLQTDIRDSEEDDGLRSVWLRGHAIIAVRNAIKVAFPGKKPNDAAVIGGSLRIKHNALGEKKPKMNQAKLFIAKFEPKSIVANMADATNASHSEANPPPPTDSDWG